jgi:hypothetical protein
MSVEIAAQYPIPPNSFGIVPALVRPQSRRYLRLKTAGHDGPLEIQPNFLAEQADVDALVAGIELGLEIASQPAFRDLIKRWVAPAMRPVGTPPVVLAVNTPTLLAKRPAFLPAKPPEAVTVWVAAVPDWGQQRRLWQALLAGIEARQRLRTPERSSAGKSIPSTDDPTASTGVCGRF